MRPPPGRRSGRTLLFGLVVLVGVLVPLVAVAGQTTQPLVLQMNIDGAITRATLEHFLEVLDAAQSQGADAILLNMNTPGGGVAETEEIVELMLNSPLPMIGYVGPAGASADSAGTWILVATDVAAMTPGTTIGSLQPVLIGPQGFEVIDDPKIVNNIVAKVKNVLTLHGRNESLADAFVRDNLNLNAPNALAAGAIEVIADDIDALMADLDGRTTFLKGVTLDLANARVVVQTPSIRLQAIGIITDPVVASLLFLLG
ncbi:MAG: ATP-dependent Clp protease proteolytic subunit, partial [Thermoplasmata archaeon]